MDPRHLRCIRFIMRTIELALVALLVCPLCAAGATYPDRPVRLIVPFPPGGVVDLIARAVAHPLAQRLGQPVVVDNRSGAGGSIGMQAVAMAPRDGYTLGLATTGPLAIDPALRSDLPYDARRDFTPISLIARAPQSLVVRADLPPR
jgi:tripartite-type tricarboxylate transporter receptor subunit TctC